MDQLRRTEPAREHDDDQREVVRRGIEVVADRRFLAKSVTTLEVAEHILQQAASGERDLDRLKSSALDKLK